MTKTCKEYLEDEIMLSPMEIKGLKEGNDLEYVEEWVKEKGKCDSYYVYESVEELGRDQADNACRDKDEGDEEFGEFLLRTPGAGYIKLASGRVLWLDEYGE